MRGVSGFLARAAKFSLGNALLEEYLLWATFPMTVNIYP
jgi:hypothetical protein